MNVDEKVITLNVSIVSLCSIKVLGSTRWLAVFVER